MSEIYVQCIAALFSQLIIIIIVQKVRRFAVVSLQHYFWVLYLIERVLHVILDCLDSLLFVYYGFVSRRLVIIKVSVFMSKHT